MSAHETPETAALEVRRRKGGWWDRFRAYEVVVDGTRIGEIRRDQSRTWNLEPGTHELHLEIDWCKSKSRMFTVKPGERIAFFCWPKSSLLRTTSLAKIDPDDY